MKTILTVALKILLLAYTLSLNAAQNIGLNDNEKEYLKQLNILTYVSDPNWLPYEGYNSEHKHIGIIPEIIKIIINSIDTEKNLHIKTIKSESWQDTLRLAKAQNVDILTSDPNDPALQGKFNHTDIYLSSPVVIIMTSNNNYIPRLEYIEHKKIAVVKDYGYVRKLEQTYPQINFVYVKNIKSGLLGVSKKEYDAFLASATAATYNISQNGLNNLSIVGSTSVNMEASFFVSNDNTLLLSILNKSIQHLHDESLNKIMTKWSVVKFTHKIDYELISKLVLIFLIALIITITWTHQLKKSKNKIDELNRKLTEKVNELEVLSITDSMTGLYNRRYFDKIFVDELNRAKRLHCRLMFAMLDVDFFKKYNDTYGHDNGDKVLIKVAEIIQQLTQRTHEFAFRIGGEEFCIITSDVDDKTAFAYIDNFRIAILDSKIKHTESSVSDYVTASFGVVLIISNSKDLTTDGIYKIADNALYKAKESGRNKIQLISI